MNRWLLQILLIGACCALAPAASAQGVPKPYDEQPMLYDDEKDTAGHDGADPKEAAKAEAKRLLLEEAEPLIKAGRCNDALYKIEKSLKLYRSPRTLYRKAFCLFTLRRYVEAKKVAEESRELALRQAKWAEKAGNTGRADSLRARADKANTLAKRAAARLSKLTILVPSSALAQQPTVQYQHIPATGPNVPPVKSLKLGDYNHPMEVDPGHYRVVSRAPGMDAWALDVYPAGGDHVVVTLPALAPAWDLNAGSGDGPPAGAFWLVGMGITGMVVGGIVGASIVPSKAAGTDEIGASLLLIGLGATTATIGAVWLASESAPSSQPSVAFGVGPTSAALRVRF